MPSNDWCLHSDPITFILEAGPDAIDILREICDSETLNNLGTNHHGRIGSMAQDLLLQVRDRWAVVQWRLLLQSDKASSLEEGALILSQWANLDRLAARERGQPRLWEYTRVHELREKLQALSSQVQELREGLFLPLMTSTALLLFVGK